MSENKERGAPPASDNVSLPFEINKSKTVTAEALLSLYHTSERGQKGAFPLGIAAQFHSGTDLLVERGKPICSIAHGEVVAARIGVGPGGHPWGDTGFVLLRHPFEDNKSIFSLFVHLRREPLHPDRTHAGWLRRLLLDGAARGKPKWRVIADAPTWKDEDKGKFSPAHVQNDKLRAGVYEEEDRTRENNDLYVKLKGQWVKVAQGGTAKVKVKELSPWVDFDLEVAAEKNQTIAALKDGKVAILDADKKDGKRRWTVEASEPIGVAGEYLGRPLVHWSVFSQAAVFPTGSLPEKEFGATDEVKVSELDLNEERGDVEHTKKLIEALDPKKKTIGKMPHHIPMPGEVELFYRTPAECWRSRYLAVKGLTEFALDADKFLQQERHKSHTAKEREQFKKNVQVFLFWKDLAKVDEFPQDGKAIFVHPATALRLLPKSKEIRATPARLPKYVFVLSLENRSFDHLFGRSGIKGKDAETKAPGKSINGVLDANGKIDPQYTNTFEPNSHERELWKALPHQSSDRYRRWMFGIPDGDAPFIMPSDPKHEFEHILCQTCGPGACRKLLREFEAAPGSFKLKKADDSFYDTVPPPPQSQPYFVRYKDATSPAAWEAGTNPSAFAARSQASMAAAARLRPKSVSARPDPNNSGFVHSYVKSFSDNHIEKSDGVPDTAAECKDPQDVMRCFDTQKQLPMLYELASNFLICDNFFSSLPGPTGPNRFFMMAGSSAGYDGGPSSGDMASFSTIGHLPVGKSNIFSKLAEAKVPFRIYGDDSHPMAGLMEGVNPWDAYDVHIDPSRFTGPSSLEAQLKDATEAKPFPYNFVWIEPDYDVASSMIPGFRHPMYSRGNSMHPCSDVRKAEKLIREIYNWISGNKSVWENCVIFITWDEHGGFYDHVPPPKATPPGDSWLEGRTWSFKFDQLGTRVPCLVISPFIESNLIDSRQYDHCSILQTVIDLHHRGAFNKGKAPSINMKPWTDRIRAAASMIGLFTQDAAKAVKVSLGTPLEPAALAASSGDQSPSQNPPSGNTLLFLASAISLHKAADPSLDVPSLVASLTTDEAVGKYFAQAAAAIDSAQEQGATEQVA